MAKRLLKPRARHAWENAYECNCGAQQDESSWGHKECFRCNGIIEYGAYEGWQPKNPSSWNVEHINPKSQGGTNKSKI